jgi:hypothetical protein
LPPPKTLSAVWNAAAAQRAAIPTVGVVVGTVEVRAPRFAPCRCAVTFRRTLNPVAEIMPDRCTPEYERTIAKMGSLLPYRRARTLLAEFLPLGKPQAVETTRQRTLRVGTRLEQEAVAGAGSKSAVATNP